MWYMPAAGYEQQKRTVEDLIPEGIQLADCLHDVNLWCVGKLLFIADYRDLCALWKPHVIGPGFVLSKFVWRIRFESRV